jgi:hypothetical protein
MEHEGVLVVRDDLFPGGTKARFLGILFNGAEEVVYASPAEGGTQVALASGQNPWEARHDIRCTEDKAASAHD